MSLSRVVLLLTILVAPSLGEAQFSSLAIGPPRWVDTPTSRPSSGPDPVDRVVATGGAFVVHGGGFGYRVTSTGMSLDEAPFVMSEGDLACSDDACVLVRDGVRMRHLELDGGDVLPSARWILDAGEPFVRRVGPVWLAFSAGAGRLQWVVIDDRGEPVLDRRGESAVAAPVEAIGCGDRQCLVVYRGPGERLLGGFVRLDGLGAWFGTVLSDQLGGAGSYAVAATDDWLLVSRAAGGRLDAVRVGHDRAVLDATPISLATDAIGHPACAAEG